MTCLAGIGRSPTLVLAHLLTARFKDEGLEAALDFMTARRPIVRPNPEQIEAARLAAFAFSDRGEKAPPAGGHRALADRRGTGAPASP